MLRELIEVNLKLEELLIDKAEHTRARPLMELFRTNMQKELAFYSVENILCLTVNFGSILNLYMKSMQKECEEFNKNCDLINREYTDK